MWSPAEDRGIRLRGTCALAATALALGVLAAGCGFQPAGKAQLPTAMQTTCVTGSQPYGSLENLLRGALSRSGVTVVEDCAKASAVLDIVSIASPRRVLVVNANGRPAEYALNYRVRFRLLDGQGRTLLAPQTLHLTREYAYSVKIELGVGREETALRADMEQEATQLIMFRLEALGRSPTPTTVPAAAPVSAT